MKRFFKLFLLALCTFSLCMSVNAETGTYAYKSTAYCFNKDGSFAANGATKVYASNNIDDGCSKYYKGTIVKTINGQNAYCVQAYSPMAIGGTCSVASYNQFGWMKGNWTEQNAIKTGYMIQYIESQNYSAGEKYVYIMNAANQMLQFDQALPVRTLNSRIQSAIDYANTKVAQYKKVTTATPVTASFANATLVNVNNSYAKGEIDLSLVNVVMMQK